MLLMEGWALSRRSPKALIRWAPRVSVIYNRGAVMQGVLETAQFGPGPVSQTIAVAGVARKIIDAVKVSVGRQPESGCAAGA
jgi:hypothetical protein